MNSKQRKTLEAIFNFPASGTVEWAEIEKLLLAVGATCKEGAGSRVRFAFGSEIATFHRPHPAKEAKPYQVHDARKFLQAIGIKP